VAQAGTDRRDRAEGVGLTGKKPAT